VLTSLLMCTLQKENANPKHESPQLTSIQDQRDQVCVTY
jgi:hypothetical protein